MNCDNNAMPSANPNSSIIKENVFSFNDEMNRIAEWPTTRKTQSISGIFLKLMRFFLKSLKLLSFYELMKLIC